MLASALVSRAPVVLPPLSPFARAYYAYQRRLARALAQPTAASTAWFFKEGSAAESAFQKFDAGVMKRERGDEKEEDAFDMAREEVAGAAEVVKRSAEGDSQLNSLDRKKDRTVYLLVKKQGAWVFRKPLVPTRPTASYPGPPGGHPVAPLTRHPPCSLCAAQGSVNAGESLVQAAEREVLVECGPDVDLWPVGQVPAGAFAPSAATAKGKKASLNANATIFFLPIRIVRGQPRPAAKGAELAWLTKEEVKGKVAAEYWAAVEPILSDC